MTPLTHSRPLAPRARKRPRASTRGFTLVEIMIVILIIGVLTAIAVPNFIRARATSRTSACLKNLRMIDGAKEQWAMDNRKNSGDACLQTDIVPTSGTAYLKSFPSCPAAGNYTIGVVGTDPTCSFGGTHVLP